MKLPHEWNVTVTEATSIQKALRDNISLVPLPAEPRTIAGADISFGRFSNVFYAGMIVLSYPAMEIIEYAVDKRIVDFPYVPGYLSFREVPVLVECYKKLKRKPDLIMMDGNGIAHPRRLGVATHLSLMLDVPVIGCAKSRLYGEGGDPAAQPGSTSLIHDPKQPEDILGAYVRTKARCKPIIVSPGNLITMDESIQYALACVRGYRIPEPTRRAHELVNQFRRGELHA